MNSVDKIIETINNDIHLHESLGKLVLEEYNCFKADDFESLPEKGRDRILLEREIEKTNNSIIEMLSNPDVGQGSADAQSVEKVSQLIQTLREKIEETMSIVEKSVTFMENQKILAAKELKSYDNKKKMISGFDCQSTAELCLIRAHCTSRI